MKRISIIITLLIGIVIMLGSCQKETKDPVLNLTNIITPEMTAPSPNSAFVLTLADSAEVITFAWDAAVYAVNDGALLPTPTYSVIVDVADSNFVNSVELVNTKDLTFDIIYYDLNEKILQLGVAAEETVNVEVKIISEISSTVGTDVESQVITYTVTTFEPPNPLDVPKLYVPGDYQGWNPGEAPNVFDYDNDGVYRGYVYFPEGGTFEFKFTSDPDWDHTNYGLGASEFELDTEPTAGNLSVPGAGGYWLEIDINALTWKYEGPENWGVIGEWLSWEEDINLIYDPVEQYLSVTVENIKPQEDQRFKFRANDDWTVNLGANDPDDGFLVQGGADIPIPEGGTITFILDFTTEIPSYRIIK
jgi:hypothetical protein